MSDVNEARRSFPRLIAVMGAVSVFSLGILLSPIGRSIFMAHAEVVRLRTELQTKTADLAPYKGLKAEIGAARDENAEFCRERLPSSYAEVSERLGELASAAGLSLASGHYRADAADVPGLEPLSIDADVSGRYLNALKFINSTEREKTFFVIQNVSLTKQDGSSVGLHIRIGTVLRRTDEHRRP
jgi:hypothetical protein